MSEGSLGSPYLDRFCRWASGDNQADRCTGSCPGCSCTRADTCLWLRTHRCLWKETRTPQDYLNPVLSRGKFCPMGIQAYGQSWWNCLDVVFWGGWTCKTPYLYSSLTGKASSEGTLASSDSSHHTDSGWAEPAWHRALGSRGVCDAYPSTGLPKRSLAPGSKLAAW